MWQTKSGHVTRRLMRPLVYVWPEVGVRSRFARMPARKGHVPGTARHGRRTGQVVHQPCGTGHPEPKHRDPTENRCGVGSARARDDRKDGKHHSEPALSPFTQVAPLEIGPDERRPAWGAGAKTSKETGASPSLSWCGRELLAPALDLFWLMKCAKVAVMHDFLNSFFWRMLAQLVALSIIAVVGWFQFRKQHLHGLRMGLFSELMGSRYNRTGDLFSTALNRVSVLFHDDPEVVRAIRDFTHAATNRKAQNRDLVTVFRAICRNLRIPDESITNADFETVFMRAEGSPIPVTLAVAHVAGAPQPQVVVFGHRAPNLPPFTVAILDAVAGQQLQQQLQQQLMQAH